MYIVTIKNGTTSTEIQNEYYKLFSGQVVQGINTIDSFTFSVLPKNPAFGALNEFTTLVSVYNTARGRYEFMGRVLHSIPSMSEKGLLTQEATCESYLGFLCDSQQAYVTERNWTVTGLLQYIIEYHNSRVESYKRFKIGTVTVTDPNNNLYCGIQRKNTWETIKEKLINTLGGEIRFREESDGLYIDYMKEIGEKKTTPIALSKNMKSIRKEKDPSSIITRLIPLGCKLKDDEGNDTENRLDITSINGGVNYIDDAEAIAEYGLHEGSVEFDDVTQPSNLLIKGQAWLKANNKVSVKYVITALDLSLIGLDIDDFETHNYHPVENKLLGIDDTARINKKNIDVCNDTKTSFEIGESFKTLSEIQREQLSSLNKINADVAIIKRDYATNAKLESTVTQTMSVIAQSEEELNFLVDAGGIYAALQLKVGTTDNDQIVSMLNASAEVINIKSNRLAIESTNFTLTTAGKITAKSGQIGGWNFGTAGLYSNVATHGVGLWNALKSSSVCIHAGSTSNNIDSAPFRVYANGNLVATQADITGNVTAESLLVNMKGGRLRAGVSFGEFVYESTNFDINAGTGTQLGISSTSIQYTHGAARRTVFPIMFTYSTSEDTFKYYLTGTWYIGAVGSTTQVTSDRNKKNSIEAQGEEYSRIFDRLKPAIFKYNDGTSDRIHTGFIAQDVEDAVLAEGMTTQQFAAVCYEVDAEGNKVNYGVRYEEIVSLNTHEIQKLKKKVAELETLLTER